MHDESTLVKPSRRLLSFFANYLNWYIGRHFHAVRLAKNMAMALRARVQKVLDQGAQLQRRWWLSFAAEASAGRCVVSPRRLRRSKT